MVGGLQSTPKSALALAWPEIEEAVRRQSVLLLPVGSVEQHGPHLPLGVDGHIPLALALELAEQVNAIVAPPVWYASRSAARSGGGEHFPGTTRISGRTLEALVGDLLDAFHRQGWRGVCVLNGHFENTAFIAEAALRFSQESRDAAFKVCLVNWWEQVSPELLHELFQGDFPGWELEHASLTETSLMMHYYPSLVNVTAIPPSSGTSGGPPSYTVFPEPAGLVPPSGILYRADLSSADSGRRLAQHLTGRILAILRREFHV